MDFFDIEYDMLAYKEFGNNNDVYMKKVQSSLMKNIDDGDVLSMERLAVLYEYGAPEYGIPKDAQKRTYWFYQAAMRGSAKGAYYYGNYLISNSDEGRLQDVEEKGMRYIKIAADKGFARAQRMAGIAYTNGWGVPISYDIAYRYLSMAIQGGDEDAQEDMQILLEKMNKN